jgi:hypothetical protein
MKKIQLFLFGALMLSLGNLTAQIATPQPSPLSTVSQRFALTDATVEYSRPSAKGRTIFGTGGIVPNGDIWRVGANSATKITFSKDVKVEGTDVKKGSYAILAKPGANSWEIHFHEHTTPNFVTYTEKVPAVVIMVKPVMSGTKFETFLINFDEITNSGATLQMIWDKTIIPIKITADSDKAVMASIDKVLAGPTPGDYFAAGSYLHDSGKDLNKALEYVRKATMVEKPAFWQVRKESLILADMGRKADAIAAAKKSLALATEAKNKDYITMNEKSIAEWSKN